MPSPEMAAYLAKRFPQTLNDVQQERRATPKSELKTKLDRAVEKKQADREDEKQLATWALRVKDRDQWKDRKTGKRVKKTRQLDPLRAEAHHIESRENLDVRYDDRNGITLAYETHDAVERNKLRIVGTKFFTKSGRKYIDATFPVRFKETA
jgi:hypothetical protein